MRTRDFHYDLPPERIAQFPASPRSASRLLSLDGTTGVARHLEFVDFPKLLAPGDLLVLNDTRVIPARLFATKDTGGRCELLVERVLDGHRVLVQARASKPLRPDQTLYLTGEVPARVLARRGEFFEIAFNSSASVTEILERIGRVPLPPYIARADEDADGERYQTVYARQAGAVAAPTAGLHFDEAMLARLAAAGFEAVCLTLHVGAGTFQPVRVADVREHRMHAEYFRIEPAAAERINLAKRSGCRVVAVGTTVVRTLEAAAVAGRVEAYAGETDIFIYPGYRFQIVDALLTNFHLPESTLLMLVCAFAGTEAVLAAYRRAVENNYRFYSYGDAMFVTPSG